MPTYLALLEPALVQPPAKVAGRLDQLRARHALACRTISRSTEQREEEVSIPLALSINTGLS